MNDSGCGLTIGDLCTHHVYLAQRSEPLAEAARALHKRHVGALAVVDVSGGISRPVGILTDRDIMKALLLRGGRLEDLVVEQAMSPEPLVVRDSDAVDVVIERMRARAVRRVPVVDAGGDLVGIVSIDDLLPHLARQLQSLAVLIENQLAREGD